MLGLSDPAWGEQVAAVIDAADPADPPTAAELHDHLRAALAPHKTPRHWYLADAIPATPWERSRSSCWDGRSVTAA